MTEAFCVRCRKKVKMKKKKLVTLRNGKQAKQGICPECGGKVSRICKKQDPLMFFLLSLFGLDED